MLEPPRRQIQAIYASHEVLMYRVDRVITDINFEARSILPSFWITGLEDLSDSICSTSIYSLPQAGTFTWLDLASVLTSLGISYDQFLDMGVMAGGFDSIPTFPLADPSNAYKCEWARKGRKTQMKEILVILIKSSTDIRLFFAIFQHDLAAVYEMIKKSNAFSIIQETKQDQTVRPGRWLKAS
jgi:hypothetical protein